MWGQRLIRFAFLIILAGGALFLIKGIGPKFQSQTTVETPSIPFEKIERQILGVAQEKILSGSEGEPIVEPAENIEAQTQTLIEMIKNLPEDQLKAVERQIYKEFCQNYCESEADE